MATLITKTPPRRPKGGAVTVLIGEENRRKLGDMCTEHNCTVTSLVTYLVEHAIEHGIPEEQ